MASFIQIRYTVDDRNLKRKMARLDKGFKKAMAKSTSALGAKAKEYAKQRAPRDTGTVIRNIHYRTLDGGNRFVLSANNPFGGGSNGKQPVRYPGRGARNFNLIRWMHTSAGAQSHIRTGDPKFMFATGEYLRRIAPGYVATEISDVVNKNN